MPTKHTSLSRRRILQTVGVGIGSTVFAGCTGSSGNGSGGNGSGGNGSGGNGSGGNGSAPKTTKVGLLLPKSGVYGYIGKPFTKTYKYAIKNINNSDKRLSGGSITIADGDTKSDPQTGLKEARRLVSQENVDILVGAASSETAGSISQFASTTDTPYQIGMATSFSLTTGSDCQYTTLRALSSTKILPKVAGAFGVNNIGKKAYLIYPDYTTGYQHRDLFPPAVKEAGGTMAGKTAAPLGNDSWGTIINKVSSANPDFVFLGNPGDGVQPFFTQAANRGFDIPVIANTLTATGIASLGKDNLQKLGPVYRYVRYTREIDNKVNRKFISNYKDEFDKPPTYSDGIGFLNANMTALALEKAGSSQLQPLMKAYETITWDSILGNMSIRSCDHQGLPNVYMGKVTGVNSNINLGKTKLIESYDTKNYITPCDQVKCSF